MARTIEYWYQQIITAKDDKEELSTIDSTSKVSTFGLLAYVFAVAAWVLDKLFDLHRLEIDTQIALEKAHSAVWYQSLAKAFQYGQAFNSQTGGYDNADLSTAQIEAQKVVAQASVTEIDGRMRIKVARLVGNDLAPLDAEQLAAFSAYIEKTKDGGVKIDKDSLPPDALKIDLDIFYDPLVLRADGSRIDGNGTSPVPDAIREYLKSLPFNGEYANTRLTDRLQLVEGVELPVIKGAFAKYGLFSFSLIDEKYIPDAGYLRISDEDLTINYRPYVQY